VGAKEQAGTPANSPSVIRAVIDTNVWVAGFLTSSGPPARIVDLVLSGTLAAVVSPAILREYEDVLLRREFDLSADDVRVALAYLKIPGAHVVHVDPVDLPGVCTDPYDDHFLGAALAGGANILVTGNTKHFPAGRWRGISITTPAAFLRTLSAEED
jgi:uncharacterized protein